MYANNSTDEGSVASAVRWTTTCTCTVTLGGLERSPSLSIIAHLHTMRRLVLAASLLLLLGPQLQTAVSAAADSGDGAVLLQTVTGVVLVPDGITLPMAQVVVALQVEGGGGRRLAFPLPDGSFSFAEVPEGVHTLTVNALHLAYPTVKLDVGAGRKGGAARVSAVAVDAPGVSAAAWVGSCRDTCNPTVIAGRHTRLIHSTLLNLRAALGRSCCPCLQTPGLLYPLRLMPMSRLEFFEVRRCAALLPPTLLARCDAASVLMPPTPLMTHSPP